MLSHKLVILTLLWLFSVNTVASSEYSEEISTKIAVIANENDPISIRVAEYYLNKRKLSPTQLYQVKFDPSAISVRPRDFIGTKTILDFSITDEIQFLVLTFTKPYRVGCMSITSAFAMGFDPAFCSQRMCSPTAVNPYFDSNSTMPYRDFKIRPTMMIAYETYKDAKQLIKRGIAADGTSPAGTAYLVSTDDQARNVRSKEYETISESLKNNIQIEIVQKNFIKDKTDVMFYFTGLKKVPEIKSNTFLPGALADHLTSTGGALFGVRQMSIMKWLQAGVTASFGTVVEPCNYPQKFPHPGIVIKRYTEGESAIEAYWKSVAWPGEGIFVGEPLSSPFKMY